MPMPNNLENPELGEEKIEIPAESYIEKRVTAPPKHISDSSWEMKRLIKLIFVTCTSCRKDGKRMRLSCSCNL